MALADYLTTESVCMDLATSQRDDALRILLAKLVEAGALPPDLVEKALDALVMREALGSTAIGNGVAVPHARMEELTDMAVGFGHSRTGIEFRSLDGEPVRAVFVVLAPKEGAEAYLDVMQRITRLVQSDDFRRFVRQAGTAEEVTELITEMER